MNDMQPRIDAYEASLGTVQGGHGSSGSGSADHAVKHGIPECMDRLPFASEGVLSEVADMYPAC
jgi:hypothetical protein